MRRDMRVHHVSPDDRLLPTVQWGSAELSRMCVVSGRVANAVDEGGLVVASLAKNSESAGTDIDSEARP